MTLDIDAVRVATYAVIAKICAEDTLDQYTQKTIRRKIEQDMGLDAGTLDDEQYKLAMKNMVKDAIAGASAEPAETAGSEQKGKKGESSKKAAPDSKDSKPRKPRSTAPKKGKAKKEEVEESKPASKKAAKGKKPARSASVVPTSDEDEGSVAPRSKAKAAAKRVVSDAEDSGAEEATEPPAKRQKTASPAKGKGKDRDPSPADAHPGAGGAGEGRNDDEKSESEMSVLEDDPPPVKKPRKKADSGSGSRKDKSTKEKVTKGRKRKEPAKELSKDEETIKRLKSLVVACGVRKVWSKELKGLDKPSEQIQHLRQMLTDLGMSGRMSLEQAKAIKEKREFEQELKDVKEFATKMEAVGHRQSKMAVDEEEPEEESDVGDIPPRKRRMNARQSIMAFLGDEDESD